MTNKLQHIVTLEDGLIALVCLQQGLLPEQWIMQVELSYQSKRVGSTSFTLDGYIFEEAEALVKNLPNNHYVMREIDHFLSGDSGE